MKRPVTFAIGMSSNSRASSECVPRARGIPKLPAGDINVKARRVEVLNSAKTPPFEMTQTAEIDDSVRLRHRYLDLRPPRRHSNLVLRHAVIREMREYLKEDRSLLEPSPADVRPKHYDFVDNGNELGGGSIRNHRRADKQRLLGLMGYSP